MTSGRLRVALLFILVGAVVHPLLALVRTAFPAGSPESLMDAVGSPSVRACVLLSAGIAAASVLGAGAVGIPLGIAAARLRCGSIFKTAALAPMLMPAVLGTLAFWFVFGRGGLLPSIVSGFEGEFRGVGAVLLIHALTLPTAFTLLVESALRRADPALFDAARSLGAGPFRAFLDGTLPQILPSIGGAAALVWMSATASFTAPFVFGTDRTLTTAIFVERQDDPARAAAIALLLFVLAAAPLIVLRRSSASARKGAYAAPPPSRGSARTWLLAIAVPIAAAVVLPLVTMFALSFVEGGRLVGGFADARFSTNAWTTVIGGSAELPASIGRSLLFSAIAVVVDIAVGTSLVLVARRASTGWRRLLLGLASIPFAVPATVLGIAMAEAYATGGFLGLGPPLVGTWAMLPFAYAVRNLPLLVQSVDAGCAMIPSGLEDASATLGATPGATVRHLLIPLLKPAIAAGATLAFAACTGEFVVSILLFDPATKPAAVAIHDLFRTGSFGVAAAAGLCLSFATLVPVLVLGRISRSETASSTT